MQRQMGAKLKRLENGGRGEPFSQTGLNRLAQQLWREAGKATVQRDLHETAFALVKPTLRTTMVKKGLDELTKIWVEDGQRLQRIGLRATSLRRLAGLLKQNLRAKLHRADPLTGNQMQHIHDILRRGPRLARLSEMGFQTRFVEMRRRCIERDVDQLDHPL